MSGLLALCALDSGQFGPEDKMANTLLLRNDHEGIIELTLNDPGTL
ncbi:MAG: hypothetical protein ACI9AX_002421, partial [Polaromonas sp.]